MGRVAREDRWQWKIRSFRDAGRERPTGCGARNTSGWMTKVKQHWEEHRTESNAKNNTSYADYLNWQNKLTDQQPGAKYFCPLHWFCQRCERCCSGDSIT